MSPETASPFLRPAFSAPALALLALLALVVLIAVPFLARLLCRALGLEKPNFRGDIVPSACGLTFLAIATFAYGGLAVSGATLGAVAPVYLLVAVGFGGLGLIDDLWGSRAVGGFRGHWKALLSGRPTTGAVKLIGGGLTALAASWLLHGFAHPLLFILDATLIALAANALNLLDARPGRAQFGFLLLSLPALWAVFAPGIGWTLMHPPSAVLLGPVILAALMEWWPDSHGRAMMGDTGSNLLGAVAGLSAALTLPLSGHFFLFSILLALNWIAEKVSLSETIDRVRWLRAIDRALGAR